MFHEAITFEYGPTERDVKVLLPHQILCVRQTANTLEVLWAKGGNRTAVIAIEGINLGILRRELLCGMRTVIQGGPQGPAWSGCTVTKIYHRLGWTKPVGKLALDPNPLTVPFLQMETGTTRDLWSHDHLDRFAIPRGTQERLLIQFLPQHAYVLHTDEGTFLTRLRELRKANFTYAMKNRFSVFHSNPYPPFPYLGLDRYTFREIAYEERDLASKAEWEVVIDFRPISASAPSVDLSLER
jgi:hypothetical protein